MFNYYIPTRILFGAGKLNELGRVQLPGKKALIVMTHGKSMRRFGILERVEKLLKQNGVESLVFDKILPNPIKEHVMEAAEIARNAGCDFILGLGGGSAIDSAKSIAVMAKNPGDYWDYIGSGTGKKQPIKNGVLPIVAITTTAGTGTEADPWTVVTNPATREKIGFGCDETFPTLSIVDPELMLTVPADLTAYQGFDAFCHSAEGYIAKTANVISDLYALKSIELVARYLPRAVKDGSDLEARSMVALANTLAGMVESTSNCTSEHSLEHALSAFHPQLAHGAGLIMLLVPYFSFFVDKVPGRLTDMARAMGVDVDALPEKERPAAFLQALKTLQASCGVDQLKMSDYGITPAEFPDMIKNARSAMGGLFNVDPAPLTDADVLKIFEAAYR